MIGLTLSTERNKFDIDCASTRECIFVQDDRSDSTPTVLTSRNSSIAFGGNRSTEIVSKVYCDQAQQETTLQSDRSRLAAQEKKYMMATYVRSTMGRG